jgi:hypothetical protein
MTLQLIDFKFFAISIVYQDCQFRCLTCVFSTLTMQHGYLVRLFYFNTLKRSTFHF